MGFDLERVSYDEARCSEGQPREGYAALMSFLEGADLEALRHQVNEALSAAGVSFGGEPFAVDPVPRIITAREWAHIREGLAQRLRALNAFLHDAYGDRRIVAEGILPAEAIEGAEGYEPDLAGRLPARTAPIGVAGFDLVRTPDGEFLVLEDNLRTPSGIAYAIAARRALHEALPPELGRPRELFPLAYELLREVLLDAVPEGASQEPCLVVLTDGPHNVAFYEHYEIAQGVGAVLATPEQLIRAGNGLRVRDGSGRERRVHVVYRRTNEDRLRDPGGEATRVGELLLEPWTSGEIGLVNAFGNGIADDKLIHGYVDDFIAFYLDETPLVRSVPLLPVALGEDPVASARMLRERVFKPRHGSGGVGVIIGAHASEEQLSELEEQLRERPEAFISQPLVPLSCHPTVIDGHLEPRHVDLRPFGFSGRKVSLLPGGLTRVALREGELVVNSHQDGGGKDTWVLKG